MGFEVTKVVRLEFEPGSILDGATVRVRSAIQIREFMALQRTISSLGDADFRNLTDEQLAQWEAVYRKFAEDLILDWDLVSDGAPIPVSGDEFLALGFMIDTAIFKAWTAVIGGPGPNSSAASASGDTPAAVSELTAVA